MDFKRDKNRLLIFIVILLYMYNIIPVSEIVYNKNSMKIREFIIL